MAPHHTLFLSIPLVSSRREKVMDKFVVRRWGWWTFDDSGEGGSSSAVVGTAVSVGLVAATVVIVD
jgi:hypothetical protein